jgi:uncharacterized protein (DUF1330 family)
MRAQSDGPARSGRLCREQSRASSQSGILLECTRDGCGAQRHEPDAVRAALGAARSRGQPDRLRGPYPRIAAEHGGKVLQRATGSGTGRQPLEIQLLAFPSARALDAFTTDQRRQSLAAERDGVIAKTEIIKVQLVQQAQVGKVTNTCKDWDRRLREWMILVRWRGPGPLSPAGVG